MYLWIGSAGASRSGNPRRSRRSDSEGFTLLEILVGFTITAVLMVLLLQVLTGGLESSHRSSDEVSAVLAAQSALEELGQSVPMRDGEERTTDRDPFRITTAVRRTTEHVAADTSALYAVPYDVRVTVTWHEGRQDRSVSLRSLRLGPQLAQ